MMEAGLDINNVLSHDSGKLYYDNDRVILTSASIFSTLRKDLIENLSEEHAKGFLIRFGLNLGKKDARRTLQKGNSSLEDLLKQGPVLHMMKGHASVERIKFHCTLDSSGRVEEIYVEGKWIDSYEADEYIDLFGWSDTPVCATMTGYASGYYSEICGQPVIFKEVACKAAGSHECRYVGKLLKDWGSEIEEERKYYSNQTIIKELEMTYDQLLEERNNLSKTFSIHNKLYEALLDGKNVKQISEIVFNETQIPIVMKDVDMKSITYSGISEDYFDALQPDMQAAVQQYMERRKNFFRAERIQSESYHYLVTPVILERKCLGFCLFVYSRDETPSRLDWLVLERVASVCALYILNEKTTFETTERIKGSFLDQIIHGQFSSKDEIIKRGRFLHLDLDKNYYIIALQYSRLESGSKNMFIFHEELRGGLLRFFKEKSNVLIGEQAGTIILLIPLSTGQEPIQPLARQVMQYARETFPGRSFKMGVSSHATNIVEADLHYKEAAAALKMAKSNNEIMFFENLGIVGMFISQNNPEIKLKARQLLRDLYRERDQHGELIKTLYIFLSNGGNLEKSMEELAISMSGLRYRIRKLEGILGKNLREPSYNHQLLLALQLLIAEGDIQID